MEKELINGHLFDEKFDVDVKQLKYSNCPDCVGIAYEDNKFVVYINTERGQIWGRVKRFVYFKRALNFARDFYLGKLEFDKSIDEAIEKRRNNS